MTKLAVLTCLGLLPLAQPQIAQTGSDAAASDDRAQRNAVYLQLRRQIFHTYDDQESGRVQSLAKANEIRGHLHMLLSREILDVLSARVASASDVVAGITAVQGSIRDKPFADFFELKGIKSLAVGYVILQGNDAIPDTQPYLEVWDQTNGTWARKAEAPTRSDFQGHTFCVSPIDAGVGGEAWFLAWGMTIGNPGTPVNVRLYAFDGNTVRTVWKRDDLTRGHVTVSKASVVLQYDREYRSSDPNNRVQETLYKT